MRLIARLQMIRLDKIADEVDDELVDEMSATDPMAVIDPILVTKWFDLLDGHHRTAGYVKWAHKNKRVISSIEVPAVVVFDRDLAEMVEHEGPDQLGAIRCAYEAAGLTVRR